MLVDISNPEDPVELDRYDTFPLNDDDGFFGCWGAYPFAAGGYVYASDIESHLTVLKLVEPQVIIHDPTPRPPENYGNLGNYPNPFNPSTTIGFKLPGNGHVSLTLFDSRGRKIRGLIGADMRAGEYQTHWDGKDDSGAPVSSGTYLYQLTVTGDQGFEVTRKMVLTR